MIAKVRIKNDIILFFDLYTGESQQPEDLSDIVNLSVQLKAEVFGHVITPLFSVTDNRIRIDVPAGIQNVVGKYILIVSYNKPNPGGTPEIKTFTIDQPAFELVARSADSGVEGDPTVQTILLNGVIGFAGPVGPAGPQGDPGFDAYEVWKRQPSNEGKTIEDYFIFLQNPAYEAGVTAVQAAHAALEAQQASEEAQSGSVAAMEKSDDFSNEAEDVEVEAGKFSSKHFSIKSAKSAEKAQKWANEALDVEVEGGEFSAKHYSLKAAASKTESESAKNLAVAAKTGAEAARDTALNTVNDVRETGEKNSVAISSLENIINSMNLNQEARATTTGVDIISLPKNASNAGMQLQLFGQSATNLVSGSSIAPGASVTFATILNNKYYVSNQPALITGDGNNYTLTNSGATTINIVAINLTATFGPGTEITDVPTLNKLFANYFEGSKNVLGTGRVRSVGKNLFENKWELNKYDDNTGEKTVLAGWIRSVNKIIIQPSTAYWFKISPLSSSLNARRVYFYDRQLNFISSVLLPYDSSGFIAPTNAYYMAVSVRFNPPESRSLNVSLTVEKSSVEVIYEPYHSSSLYLTTSELRSNGLIKDEIRKGTNGYELVKRVGVGTLGANGIAGGDFEGGLIGVKSDGDGSESTWSLNTSSPISGNQDGRLVLTTQPASLGRPFLTFTTTRVSGQFRKVSFKYKTNSGSPVLVLIGTGGAITTAVNKSLSSSGLFEYYYVCTGTGNIGLYFAKSGLFDIQLDDIKDELINTPDGAATGNTATVIGSNVHYTLAAPVITAIPHAGLLNSNSNGTLYFEPVVADAGVYSTKIDIQLTDYPISSLERIIKRVNGVDVELSTSTAVIAANGLSFTHPSLAAGDLVMFTYNYANESIGRSMTLTHYDNRYVIADTANGKVYRWSVVSTNGVPSLTLIEV